MSYYTIANIICCWLILSRTQYPKPINKPHIASFNCADLKLQTSILHGNPTYYG